MLGLIGFIICFGIGLALLQGILEMIGEILDEVCGFTKLCFSLMINKIRGIK